MDGDGPSGTRGQSGEAQGAPRRTAASAGALEDVARDTGEAAPPPPEAEFTAAAAGPAAAGVLMGAVRLGTVRRHQPGMESLPGQHPDHRRRRSAPARRGPAVWSGVLAVVLAAVVLGVGAGVADRPVERRGGSRPAGQPTPPTVASTPAVSPTPTPLSPTPTPTAPALPQSAEPLGDEVIVWPRVRNANWDIALLDLETGKETRLTDSPLEDSFPLITRDRRTIIYNQVTATGGQLRVMGADGSDDRVWLDELPEGCGAMRRPAMLPNGQFVVMCAAADNSRLTLLIVITPKGKLVRQLASAELMGDTTVTPDGRSVIYWRNDEGTRDGGPLFRLAIDGKSNPVPLTNTGNGIDADPVVSPNGKRIAFRRYIDDVRFVVTAPFDGRKLTAAPEPVTDGENDQDPSWSPDGQRIAYKQGPSDNADLRVVDLDSGESTVVVKNSAPDTAPAWTSR